MEEPQDIEREARKREALESLAMFNRPQDPGRLALKWDQIFSETRDPLDALQALHEAAKAQVPIPEACSAWLASVSERRTRGETRLSEVLGTKQSVMRNGRQLTPGQARRIRSQFPSLCDYMRKSHALNKGRGGATLYEAVTDYIAKCYGVKAKTIQDVLARRKTYRE